MAKPAIFDVGAYMADPWRAVSLLASYLRDGSLSLAIGAGASKGLGLPDWRGLVQKCVRKTNAKTGKKIPGRLPVGADNKTICQRMDQVELAIGGKLNMGRSKEYRKLVRECLYEGIGESYGNEILKKELLIALGALMMGSKRGSVREVFNFNFDDVLDWYLRLHGFHTQILTTLPVLKQDADVTIYHPHGYLPLEIETVASSNFLVFSQHSYDTKLGAYWEPWLDLWKTTLASRAVVFVGLSGDDQTLGPALADVQPTIEKTRFTGFWLLGPGSKKSTIEFLAARNIVPLRLKKFEEYPTFLLEVCRKALGD